MAAPSLSSALNSLSSLSLSTSSRFSLLPPPSLLSKPLPLLFATTTLKSKPSDDIDTSFFDNINPQDDITFNPPEPPEGFVAPPSFDDGPLETEDEIAAAYEEIYGPGYSGVSVLGNDVYVMDAKVKKETGFGSGAKKEKVRDGFEERVVQVRRVTKVVKGGKQLRFRAVVVVGDKKGQVGVGVGKAKEVIAAVQKSAVNARRNIIKVPMTKYSTFPHRYVLHSQP